jgi:protein O-mannosyl-transferase
MASMSMNNLISDSSKNTLIFLILLLAGVAVYSNSFHAPLIFDDDICVLKNPDIRTLSPIWRPLLFNDHSTSYGRSISNFSYALNYAMGGVSVYSYHVMNVLIHVFSAAFLFGIVRRTLLLPPLKDRLSQQATGLGFTISLLWMLHPIQTACVTYIAQRPSILVGFFYLLTLYCFIRSQDSSPSLAWQVGAILACALGMLSKEIMITCPMFIFLYDRIFCSLSFKTLWEKRRKFYCVLGALMSIPLMIFPFKLQTAIKLDYAGFHYQDLTPWIYLKTQMSVIIHYLKLIMTLGPLSLDYSWPVAHSLESVWPQALAVVCLLTASLIGYYRKSAIGLLGLSFFLILVPTSSFFPIKGELIKESRAYLPLAPVMPIFVLSGYYLLKRFVVKRWVWVLVVGILSLVLGQTTYARNADYHSALSIWKDTVDKYPQNARALKNLGAHYSYEKKYEEALDAFQRVIQLEPSSRAYSDLGVSLGRLGRKTEAKAAFEKAFEFKDRYWRAYANFMAMSFEAGLIKEAIEILEEGILKLPHVPDLHALLGNLYLHEDDVLPAHREYLIALQMDPQRAPWFNTLGVIHVRRGEIEEARMAFMQALRIDPNYQPAQVNLEKTKYPQIQAQSLMIDKVEPQR